MSQTRRGATILLLGLAANVVLAATLLAEDALQWSGFAIVRGASNAPAPLESDRVSSQIQIGLDWSPSPALLCHVNLIARTDAGDSLRGHAGTPEAYLEAKFRPGESRFRLRAGAFFLPTSRENVDALWENPYTISSSALNTWFGEELRPIGVDAEWRRGGAVLGATVFRGNDTLGALPVDRGWELHDRWTLLGEQVESGSEHYTSVSAENDGRLGWSGRAGWNGNRFSVLFTHIDNRSDGLPYGKLYNWTTRFEVAGFDLSLNDWTVAGEAGWGPTSLFVRGTRYQSELRAGYLLLSRRLSFGRASVRFDSFSNGESDHAALTLAAFWTPAPKLAVGLELMASGDARRALVQLRYSFSGR